MNCFWRSILQQFHNTKNYGIPLALFCADKGELWLWETKRNGALHTKWALCTELSGLTTQVEICTCHYIFSLWDSRRCFPSQVCRPEHLSSSTTGGVRAGHDTQPSKKRGSFILWWRAGATVFPSPTLSLPQPADHPALLTCKQTFLCKVTACKVTEPDGPIA